MPGSRGYWLMVMAMYAGVGVVIVAFWGTYATLPAVAGSMALLTACAALTWRFRANGRVVQFAIAPPLLVLWLTRLLGRWS